MTEKFLTKVRNNDTFSQWLELSKRQWTENLSQLTERLQDCHHLFVRLKKGTYYVPHLDNDPRSSSIDELSPEIVECVHCGLTNKFILIEDDANWDKKDAKFMDYAFNRRSYVTKEFVRMYGWKKIKTPEMNLISTKKLPSNHVGVLYQIALVFAGVEGDTSNDNVFRIMEELHGMETPQEKIKISSVVHASALIERYKKHNKF